GGRQPVDVDVRVVAATNRDLGMAIKTGAFRRDLFYRLSVVTFTIPPLRKRPEDLESLATYFFNRYATMYNRHDLALPDERLFRFLRTSTWEGNIRELENVIKRIILLGGVEHVSEEFVEADREAGDAGREADAPAERDGRPVPLREA